MTDFDVPIDRVEQELRTAYAVGLIHSGWYDGADEPDAADLVQWHPCNDHEACQGYSCKACAGRPYTSDLIWSKVDQFGHLTRALDLVRAEERAKVAEEIATSTVTPGPWKALPAPPALGHPDGTWLVVGPRTDNGEPHTVAVVYPCDDDTHPGRAAADAHRIADRCNAEEA